MYRVDIEERMNQLKRELERVRDNRQKLQREREQQENLIYQARVQKQNIEDNVQASFQHIANKVQGVNARSRFRTTYLENIKSILYGQNYSKIIEESENIGRQAQQKYWRLDEDIRWCNSEIQRLEREIDEIYQQLTQLEG